MEQRIMEVLRRMQPALEDEELRELKNVLHMVFSGCDVAQKTEVQCVDDSWRIDLEDYLMSKALEGKSTDTRVYVIGQVYTTQVDDLSVRTGPGTNNPEKSYAELSSNAQQHAHDNGRLKKGTRVTCKDVRKVGSDIWIKIPSGWIAAYYGGKKYVG